MLIESFSAAIASLGYEKVCVLFNIAALQSAVAAIQSIENDDSLKLAAKLLQVSHYFFFYKDLVTIIQSYVFDLLWAGF